MATGDGFDGGQDHGFEGKAGTCRAGGAEQDHGFESRHEGRHIMLYFGSFNPVHRGHIAIAEHVIERELADMVVLVVSPQNPFKEIDGLAPEFVRFEGAETAAAASRYPDQIAASAVEMTLPKPSYTIDTLRFLSSEFPEARFSILMGADNALRLEQWKEADKILGRFEIFVYPRGGFESSAIGSGSEVGDFPTGVTVLEGAPLFDVSSTEVRALLESGKRHFEAGETGVARSEFVRALELAPTNVEAKEYLKKMGR